MSVNLTKKQTINLSKDNHGLKHVFLGLGWDVVKSGFFKSIFGGNSQDIDLDASCLMFDNQKNLVDTVWFRKLQSSDGAVIHTGDNLTGEGDGDDEVIRVNLEKLPSHVQTLVFVITSFRGQTFANVDSAFCRLVNEDDNKEIAKYILSGKNHYTGQVMAKLYKENGSWFMQAIGEMGQGSTQKDLLPLVQNHL